MKEIKSKKENNDLLCVIYFKEDLINQEGKRFDITPEDKFIQLAAMKESKGRSFPAHRHLPQKRNTDLTQESLIILKGSIKTRIYDLDNSFVEEFILKEGDSIVLFRGGHGFEILEDDTLFYEHKNGPYQGIGKDKVTI
jgi:hypothetical protein